MIAAAALLAGVMGWWHWAGPDEAWIDQIRQGPDLQSLCATPPRLAQPGWEGPLFEAHVHSVPSDVGQEGFARALLAEMNEAGIARTVVSGFSVRPGSLSIPEVRELERAWIPIVRSCDRLLYQLSAVDLREEDPAAWVEEMLDAAPFAGVGALDFEHRFGSIDPLDPRLHSLYSLLAQRGLPLQFHGVGEAASTVSFTAAVAEVAHRWPTLRLLWFPCPPDVDLRSLPDTVSCSATGLEFGCRGPCLEAAREGRAMLGTDVGPAHLNPWSEDDAHSLAAQSLVIRTNLAALPEATARSLAVDRWQRVFGSQPAEAVNQQGDAGGVGLPADQQESRSPQPIHRSPEPTLSPSPDGS